jgi:hypothetical protein
MAQQRNSLEEAVELPQRSTKIKKTMLVLYCLLYATSPISAKADNNPLIIASITQETNGAFMMRVVMNEQGGHQICLAPNTLSNARLRIWLNGVYIKSTLFEGRPTNSCATLIQANTQHFIYYRLNEITRGGGDVGQFRIRACVNLIYYLNDRPTGRTFSRNVCASYSRERAN